MTEDSTTNKPTIKPHSAHAPETRESAIDLVRSKGRSIAATARELGVTRGTVKRWLAASSPSSEIAVQSTQSVSVLTEEGDMIEGSPAAVAALLMALR